MSSFSFDLTVLDTFGKETLEQAPRKVALEVFSRVVKKTPVKTGRARGNWQVSVGSPVDGVLDVEDKGGGATISAITNGVESWEPIKSAIFLSNNVPYIGKLERGGSQQQAPDGMVKTTLSEYRGIVNDVARETGK